jgi:hypothetical protein
MRWKNQSLFERFNSHWTMHEPSGCWVWTASCYPKGYGQFQMGTARQSQMRLAHRISYQLYVDRIPEGIQVCHTCDNRRCVNPEHLFLGTQKDNIQDAMSKGRMILPEPKKGELNNANKLTVDQVKLIRESADSQRAVARQFGISQRQVGNILHRRQWSHV